MVFKHATRIFLTTALVVFVLGLSVPASASSCCDDLKKYFQSLSATDFGLVDQAAQKTLNAVSVGSIYDWNNAETGGSGTVQFILRYRSENVECRKLWYILDIPQQSQEVWEVNSCKSGDSWTLSQSPKLL